MKSFRARHLSRWTCVRWNFGQNAKCPYGHVSNENLFTSAHVMMERCIHTWHYRQVSDEQLYRLARVNMDSNTDNSKQCSTCQDIQVWDGKLCCIPRVMSYTCKMNITKTSEAAVNMHTCEMKCFVVWQLCICARVGWKIVQMATCPNGHN